MPSVVITGANRGIGEAFVRYYASQPDTQVFGIVRNKQSAQEKIAGLKNVTWIEAAITNAKSMSAAADEVSKATGGTLDILIPNAGIGAPRLQYQWKGLPEYGSADDMEADLKDTFQVNVIGVAFTINAFLPLIRKGQTKKIAAISSGMALNHLINDFNVGWTAPYAMSKAALNTMVAKYSVFLKEEGVLVFAISPGFVATDMNADAPSEEDMPRAQKQGEAFMKFQPDWNGQPITTEESARLCADVIKQGTIEKYGGDMVSQHGNYKWL